MSEEFKIEIINPEKLFFSNESVTEAVVPAFEGEMGILKDHISIISFLKPGIITIHTNSLEEKFYVEEGTVEFSKNNLLILTSTAKDLKNFDKSLINSLLEQAEKKLQDNNSTDKEKYIVSYQIDTLKEINR